MAEYLRQNGCFVIQSNYRAGRGLHDEIDIIACDGRYLIFTEVKTRSAGAMLPGILAVTPQKQRRAAALRPAVFARPQQLCLLSAALRRGLCDGTEGQGAGDRLLSQCVYPVSLPLNEYGKE